jgi:5'-nucleotidase
MGMTPLILLANDDGIHSPCLLAAAQVLCEIGELMIVAPATQHTGMGRSIPKVEDGRITEEHLAVRCQEVPMYAITGSPAQAVTYAVMALAPRRPALVVSGINYGENLGSSVTASGTVGAALEAASYGIPALAVSLETDQAFHFHHGEVDWAAAAHFTGIFARKLLNKAMPFDVDLLKIDIPATATPATPWRVTRQSRQPYYVTLPLPERASSGTLTDLPYGVEIDWLALEPDSDICAFARDRIVAVTPMSLDLTSRVAGAAVEQLLRA